MAEWRNGGVAEWQIIMDNDSSYSSQIMELEEVGFRPWNGGMADWRNGGMAEWRNGRSSWTMARAIQVK